MTSSGGAKAALASGELDYSAVEGKMYLLASPSIGYVAPVAASHLRAAIMYASNCGAKWGGDACITRGTIQIARNATLYAVDALRKDGKDIEGVFWVDDDIIMPKEALVALAALGEDFACGVYCQREDQLFPLVGRFLEHQVTEEGERGEGFQWAVNLPENTIMPADGCGFGIVYTSTKMLDALGKDPFAHISPYSEDLSFCLRAKRAGFQLYCLTGILCGHLKEQEPVTYEHFREKWLSNPANKDMIAPDSAA